MHTQKINETRKNEFKQLVIEQSEVAVVKFTADWSGSCQIAQPIFSELSKRYNDKVNFFTVDVEKSKRTVEQFNVRELPHFLFFKNGELVDQVIGSAPKTLLENKLKNLL
ncbi:MAG: thioredoxin family protein [Bacteroidia bacterium]